MWTARWVDLGDRLIDWIQEDVLPPDLDERVVEFVDSDGNWDVDKLSQILRHEALEMVIGMSPPQANKGDDQWVWGKERDGKFSIKSAYSLICDLPADHDPHPWEIILKWRGLNRIRCFLWIAANNRILTNAQRQRRNMTQDASCSIYNNTDESVTHVLRDCNFARDVWTRLTVFDIADPHWVLDPAAWIFHPLKSGNGMLFGITCWQLWKFRNERIFTDSITSTTAAAIKIGNWLCSIKKAMERDNRALGVGRPREVVDLAWDPGPIGWMVLNTDGSVNPNRRQATAGGLLRDADGRCSLAYTMNLRNCSITRAEMRGALRGLELAWDAGYRKLIVRLDSMAAVQLLTNSREPNHQHGMETLRFRELISRNWEVIIEHTYRERNCTTDYLASLGYDYPFGSHMVSTSDCNLGYFLRYDSFGISIPRSILIND
ncbi:Putative ribonuclease H protein At1g65750 [Linum perenne]